MSAPRPAGSFLELHIEAPAAGGRMLARHDGAVVLVSGAIPGERVRARVERTARGVVWAATEDVLEPSADRRAVTVDPACGGSDYLHIAYDRQTRLKSEVIADAFRRIGKLSIEPVCVEPSPEQGYRVRARLHVRNGRCGFFLEGTHTVCDAAATGQLLPDASEAAEAVLEAIGTGAAACEAVIVAENVRGTERVLHLEPAGQARVDLSPLRAFDDARVTGVTTGSGGRIADVHKRAVVTDVASDLLGDESSIPRIVTWTRHATSFFQGNRYLTGPLLGHVIDRVGDGRIADLYSGVGLFAVAAASRGSQVLAVEGDPVSSRDLEQNAEPWRERLRVLRASVESAAPVLAGFRPESVIVDPPRTGLSAEAMRAVASLGAASIVYVSCDPATLARDAARILAAGYQLRHMRAFDLFPNTAHVETVAEFARPER